MTGVRTSIVLSKVGAVSMLHGTAGGILCVLGDPSLFGKASPYLNLCIPWFVLWIGLGWKSVAVTLGAEVIAGFALLCAVPSSRAFLRVISMCGLLAHAVQMIGVLVYRPTSSSAGAHNYPQLPHELAVAALATSLEFVSYLAIWHLVSRPIVAAELRRMEWDRASLRFGQGSQVKNRHDS
ncbi:MAG: hypothetical protein QM784_02020 [Polyangiaceae bacterium]